VADILALLDSLPYDALDLRTDRFHLTLRRTPSDGWTEESEVLTRPTDVTPVADTPAGDAASPAGAAHGAGGTAGADGAARASRGAHGTPDPGGALRANESPLGATADSDGLAAVVAPLPGTFYRAPRPGAPPFVEVGDAVGADTVVAIIETMKLMNSVPAGTPGRVARILVDNGEFAPLGATLLLIEPDPRPLSEPSS
jgi:acetyl-CoA carboxylase biotin carboxyl carrier protein